MLNKQPKLISALLKTWPKTKKFLRRHGEEAITIFHSIIRQKNVETLKLVLGVMNKNAVNISSSMDGTFLHAAIDGGVDVVNKINVLFEHGADPSIIDGSHRTTLNVAAYFHFKSVIQLLLDKLSETTSRRRFINVIGVQKRFIQAAITGLRNAIFEKNAVDLLEFLRSEGAPLTHSRIYGENFLHAAIRVCFGGYFKNVVKWLLESDVDVDKVLYCYVSPKGEPLQ